MKLRRKVLAVGVLAAISGGTLLAQPTRTAPVASLSRLEMRAQAESLDKEVKLDLRRVMYLQQVARKQQDVIKLNCVNEKFIEIKAHANLFDKSRLELNGAEDDSQATSAFNASSKAAADAKVARIAADGCVGEGELSSESTTLVDYPDLDDPTLGDPFKPAIEPPAYASPFY